VVSNIVRLGEFGASVFTAAPEITNNDEFVCALGAFEGASLLKVDRDSEIVWSLRWEHNAVDWLKIQDIEVNRSGDIFLAGIVYGPGPAKFDPNGPSYTIEELRAGAFVIKLSSNGEILWVNWYSHGSRNDLFSRELCVWDNQIYVLGTFTNNISIEIDGIIQNINSPVDEDGDSKPAFYFLELDDAGNFIDIIYGTRESTGDALCKDSEGNIYIGGSFSGGAYILNISNAEW